MADPHAPAAPVPYSDQQTRAWLSWLARRMQRYGQTVFLIEHLQPHWLARPWQRLLYLAVYSPLIGLIIGWILQQAWVMGERLDPPCPAEAWIPLWLWWAVTSVWILGMGGLDALRPDWVTPSAGDTRARRALQVASRLALYFLTWVATWVMVRWLVGDSYATWAGMGAEGNDCGRAASSHLSLTHPVISGAYVAFVYGSRVSGGSGVSPVEALGWSWKAAVRGVLLGGLAGLGVWVVYFAVRIGANSFGDVARNLLLYPPLGAAGGFLLGGLSIHAVHDKTAPNQGMRLSLRNGAIAGILFGTVLGLVCWPVLIVALEPARGALIYAAAPGGAFTFGVIAALVSFSWFGGMDVLMHAALRLVLCLTRQAPADFARFLDYAAELNFVRKVGGGYMFIHRHLLEHFVAMGDDQERNRSAAGGEAL